MVNPLFQYVCPLWSSCLIKDWASRTIDIKKSFKNYTKEEKF